MSKISKQELLTMVRNIEEALTNFHIWKTDISEVVWEIKKQIDILQEKPMDKDEHNMQLQIDILMNIYKNQQRDITNIKEWVSNLEIEQTQPNVTLPKSTRYDAEVGSRLDSLEARMDMGEGMFKKEPEPEPQTERKIVFDYWIGGGERNESPIHKPTEFYEVIEMYKIGENKYLFGAKDKSWQYPYIYIGHYE
jgi:hypothetical protein